MVLPPMSSALWQVCARGSYSLLLRLLSPLHLARLWWRGRREPLYRHALGERFGFHRGPAATPGWVWVHAVSLGETRAASALLAALRAARPGLRLLLTHGTATGFEAGKALLHDGDQQTWLPYDTPGAVRRFLRHFRPAVGVVMETEVWPNLMNAAGEQGLPMVLANARLSEKSARKGRRFDVLLRPAAADFSRVLAQTQDDARRLQEAGAPVVQVVGNLKFDVTPDDAQRARGQTWRTRLARPVLLAASTREGEEASLMAAWQRRRQQTGVPALLLIVPRHPQRFDEVATLAQAAGGRVARRSQWALDPDEVALQSDVWVGDSLGEMALYYALADAALLGGSFGPFGGQNLIEAAACGCPMAMGPHTFNFAAAAELALSAGAAARVTDMDEALQLALSWLQQPMVRARMSEAALGFAAEHRGAAIRSADEIVAMVPLA
jgi:3-deoxy-D-manno-octulosonic-acid transferase